MSYCFDLCNHKIGTDQHSGRSISNDDAIFYHKIHNQNRVLLKRNSKCDRVKESDRPRAWAWAWVWARTRAIEWMTLEKSWAKELFTFYGHVFRTFPTDIKIFEIYFVCTNTRYHLILGIGPLYITTLQPSFGPTFNWNKFYFSKYYQDSIREGNDEY